MREELAKLLREYFEDKNEFPSYLENKNDLYKFLWWLEEIKKVN